MVCYKSSAFSYAIAKRIVQLDYISLVNLILQKEVVKELIQEDCTHEMITKNIKQSRRRKVREKIEHDYQGLTKLLGERNASQEVAQAIIAALQ